MRTLIGALIVLGAWAAPGAQSHGGDGAYGLPETVTVGDHRLHLNGIGVRKVGLLLDTEVYACALYVTAPSPRPEALIDPAQPVAILINVIYDDPPDEMPEAWHTVVRTELTDQMFRNFRAAYRELEGGDQVGYVYVPGSGTQISVNGERVAFDPDYGLIGAMLNQWIGVDPVDDAMRLTLLSRTE